MRRNVVRTILASALALAGARARAQRALATPPGSGRAPLSRPNVLPLAQDLSADARVAAHERKPLLLYFDREECPYCERALREYLVPLSRDEWKARALFRQIEIDRELPATDFDGRATTHRALARSYAVRLSPTVIVVDANGRPLADPIVGLMPDFYAGLLDQALDKASAALR
jgi:thioredoxin-related protein